MDNTILIWKYLLPVLKTHELLNNYVEGRIYPLEATDGNTKYPFVLYKRDSIFVEYTKTPFKGWSNKVTISLGVYSEDYTTGVEILNIIREIFENKTMQNNEIQIDRIQISDVSETRGTDCYIQSISFTFLAE